MRGELCVLNYPKIEKKWCEVKACERILISCIYAPNTFAENIEMLN